MIPIFDKIFRLIRFVGSYYGCDIIHDNLFEIINATIQIGDLGINMGEIVINLAEPGIHITRTDFQILVLVMIGASHF